MRVLLLLVGLSVAPCLAQPATVDGELALGLLRLDSADGLERGTMPDDLRRFLPNDATVVGSLDQADEMGLRPSRFVTVLAKVDAGPQAAADAYAVRTFPGFQSPPDSNPSTKGFITTPLPITSFSYRATEGEAAVNVTFFERPWGGSFVSIRKRALYAFERQSYTPGEAERRVEMMEQVLPALTAPPDTRLVSTGGGGSTDRQTSEAVLHGEIPLADLAEHFGRQISAAGWAPGGETMTSETAASLWTRTDGERSLTATFYARRVAPGQVELRMYVGAIDG